MILLDTLQNGKGTTDLAVVNAGVISLVDDDDKMARMAVVDAGDSNSASNPVVTGATLSVQRLDQEILDAVDEDGNTALHVATWAGEIDKVT